MYTPIAAVKSARGNVHRVEALHHRRGIVVEDNRGVAVAECDGVRRDCVHREVGWPDRCRIHRVGQVDNEVHRLGTDDAVAGRTSGGHGKTHQFPIGVGILLRLAIDGVPPVDP